MIPPTRSRPIRETSRSRVRRTPSRAREVQRAFERGASSTTSACLTFPTGEGAPFPCQSKGKGFRVELAYPSTHSNGSVRSTTRPASRDLADGYDPAIANLLIPCHLVCRSVRLSEIPARDRPRGRQPARWSTPPLAAPRARVRVERRFPIGHRQRPNAVLPQA